MISCRSASCPVIRGHRDRRQAGGRAKEERSRAGLGLAHGLPGNAGRGWPEPRSAGRTAQLQAVFLMHGAAGPARSSSLAKASRSRRKEAPLRDSCCPHARAGAGSGCRAAPCGTGWRAGSRAARLHRPGPARSCCPGQQCSCQDSGGSGMSEVMLSGGVASWRSKSSRVTV